MIQSVISLSFYPESFGAVNERTAVEFFTFEKQQFLSLFPIRSIKFQVTKKLYISSLFVNSFHKKSVFKDLNFYFKRLIFFYILKTWIFNFSLETWDSPSTRTFFELLPVCWKSSNWLVRKNNEMSIKKIKIRLT